MHAASFFSSYSPLRVRSRGHVMSSHTRPKHAASRFRVAMVIDRLEQGGAQRQFCLLASGLRRLSCTVEVFTLRNDTFFRHLLAGPPPIPVTCLGPHSRPVLLFVLRKAIRQYRPDAVVSFLSWPNFLLELSGLPRRKFSILVSERNVDSSLHSIRPRIRYFFHRCADAVVSNSYTQAGRIAKIYPVLVPRLAVITNAVDTDYFRPRRNLSNTPHNSIRMLVLARVAPQKNIFRLIAAAAAIKRSHPRISLTIEWYGQTRRPRDSGASRWERKSLIRTADYYKSATAAIAANSLSDSFFLRSAVIDVRPLYASFDVLCLPSLYEGYSNVIAEAMASGVPVLASAVGDNDRLVQHGTNGFLFDPLSVQGIVETIVRFADLRRTTRTELGVAGRQLAQEFLSSEPYAKKYFDLIRSLNSKTRRI